MGAGRRSAHALRQVALPQRLLRPIAFPPRTAAPRLGNRSLFPLAAASGIMAVVELDERAGHDPNKARRGGDLGRRVSRSLSSVSTGTGCSGGCGGAHLGLRADREFAVLLQSAEEPAQRPVPRPPRSTATSVPADAPATPRCGGARSGPRHGQVLVLQAYVELQGCLLVGLNRARRAVDGAHIQVPGADKIANTPYTAWRSMTGHVARIRLLRAVC